MKPTDGEACVAGKDDRPMPHIGRRCVRLWLAALLSGAMGFCPVASFAQHPGARADGAGYRAEDNDASCSAVASPWCTRDDAGRLVSLRRPARRIVSLAPHVTELVYAAGGGAWLVGAVNYSDYPPAARTLPRVGGYASIDIERIAALHPDLIVAWRYGNADRQLDALTALGIPVFVSEPRHVDDIGTSLRRLGALLGTASTANQEAARLETGFAALRERYARRSRISVFYQVWTHPLMTLSGRQITSDVIALCGGRNVFADLPGVAPTVSAEAVIAAAPQAIVAPAAGATRNGNTAMVTDWTAWQAWPLLPAVAAGNLFSIDGDLISRPGPRLLDGARLLCEDLDRARRRLGP
ncbi:cobalamin-binding protein [Robbsia andropogonis]|uniref:cobalamin-binding protein n=1 Tax=Robbsia andropogonis TaxID=28092 RepID=UPI000465CF7D|nr:cobalamin-binding protein [Robbsia andropogonis]